MHHYVLPVIGFGPQVIRDVLDGIDEKDWDTPTHPGRFSPREVVAHLRFWEPVAQWRMRTAAETSGAEVPNWDEGQDVHDNDYASRDPRTMLAEWAAERARTAEFLAAVDPAKHENFVVHGTYGRITLNDLANLAIAHDMYHVKQLLDFAAQRC